MLGALLATFLFAAPPDPGKDVLAVFAARSSFLGRGGKGFLDRPANEQAVLQTAITYRKFLAPILETLRPAVEGYEKSAPLIPTLLSTSCPSAVARLVISTIVDAINGGLVLRAFAHILQKCLKGFTPTLAYLNAATAVIAITLIFRIFAASLHADPNLIFAGWSPACCTFGAAVFDLSRLFVFPSPATATGYDTLLDYLGGKNNSFAAIASALPDCAAKTFARETNDCETPKVFASQVLKLGMVRARMNFNHVRTPNTSVARVVGRVSARPTTRILGTIAAIFSLLVLNSPVPAANPGGDFLRVAKARCAACHGGDVAQPKGDPPFGYVLDLARLAADKSKITPGDPDNSDLWTLVSAGNMPPGDAETGPLTDDEKTTVRNWITAGAPVPLPSSEEPEAAPAPATRQAVVTPEGSPTAAISPAPVSGFHRTMKWMGKWHLLTLHFPIALLVAAAVRELWSIYRRAWEVDNEVRFGLAGAAVSGVAVAALGWLHAYNGAGAGSPILPYHRWLGTVAAVLIVVLAWRSEADARAGRRSLLTRVGIFTLAGLVSLVAHFGAITLHGALFLDW